MAQMGNIEVQPAELRTLANEINQQQQALEQRMNEVTQQMNALEGNGFESDSGRALRARWNAERQKYNAKYPPAFQSYMTFLRDTADRLEADESARRQKVDNLTSLGR